MAYLMELSLGFLLSFKSICTQPLKLINKINVMLREAKSRIGFVVQKLQVHSHTLNPKKRLTGVEYNLSDTENQKSYLTEPISAFIKKAGYIKLYTKEMILVTNWKTL